MPPICRVSEPWCEAGVTPLVKTKSVSEETSLLTSKNIFILICLLYLVLLCSVYYSLNQGVRGIWNSSSCNYFVHVLFSVLKLIKHPSGCRPALSWLESQLRVFNRVWTLGPIDKFFPYKFRSKAKCFVFYISPGGTFLKKPRCFLCSF